MTPDNPWPGADLYTLRGMIELDLALDTDVPVDAAHAVLSDGMARAFGPRWFEWVTEALAAQGQNPEDLSVVLIDDRVAGRVLEHVRTRMGHDHEAPDPPDTDTVWSAFAPDDPKGGREAFRRAVRGRRAAAERALWSPRRRRVAGPRATGGRA